MYIKFWRSYVEDKKDEAEEKLESKIFVNLDGEKAKQTEGNARLYRIGCLFLLALCFILLFVVIMLSLKHEHLSQCSMEVCQELYPTPHSGQLGCQQCGKGWLAYGRTCFFLSTFRLPWAESQRNCTSMGGSLAVITNVNMQKFLTSKGKLKYWIGLKEKNSMWSWVNNDELTQSYWTGSPNHGDCAYLSSDLSFVSNWDRASCQATTYYICQIDF